MEELSVHSKKWLENVVLSGEIWQDMVSVPGYQISTFGRARSMDREIVTSGGVRHYKGKILKQRLGTTGYLYVMCYVSGERTVVFIHQEVAKTFIGKSNGLTVDHINAIKTDNSLSNLRYMTLYENVARANRGKFRDHTLEKNTRAKTVVGYKDGKEVERFDCGKKLHFKTGIPFSTLKRKLQEGGITIEGVFYRYEGNTHKRSKLTDRRKQLCRS